MKRISKEKIFEAVKPYLALIILILVFAIGTKGQSLTTKNIKIVMEQSMALMLASTGVFFVMTTGMMDLSISGVVCVCFFACRDGDFLLSEPENDVGNRLKCLCDADNPDFDRNFRSFGSVFAKKNGS